MSLRVLAAVLFVGAALAARAEPQASPRWGSFELAAGPYRPNIDAEFGGYGPYKQVFGTDRRWQFRAGVGKSLYTGFGDVEVGIRTGYFRASGRSVYFANGAYQRSADDTSLNIIPTALTLTYYFDVLAERYRWVPITLYGRGALERYNWWTAGGPSKRGATNGFSFTGGLALLLDSLDPDLARDLDNETGINHTYLFADVTWAKIDDFGSSKSWDLSPDKPAFAFGLLMMF